MMTKSLYEYLRKIYIYELIFLTLLPTITILVYSYLSIGDNTLLVLNLGLLPFFIELFILLKYKNVQDSKYLFMARSIHVIVFAIGIIFISLFIPAFTFEYFLFIPLGVSMLSFHPFFGKTMKINVFIVAVLLAAGCAYKEQCFDPNYEAYQQIQSVFTYYLLFISAGLIYISYKVNEKHRNALELKEHQLITKITDLKKAHNELEAFSYRAAHDFRGPLVSLQGLLELVSTEVHSKTLQDLTQMGLQSMHRLDELIKNLISITKNGSLEVGHSKIVFRELITKKLEEYQWEMSSKKIKWNINCEQACEFHSDPIRLEYVFDNLLSNAVKYYDKNKEQSYLNIKVLETPDNMIIYIEDNGLGIRAEQLDKIFDMYHRADTSSKGSGLGLYIVKEAIQRLGGQISVFSVYGEGTQFKIILPK